MTGSEGSIDIEVSEVATQTADIMDSIPEPLISKCKSEDEKSATETVNTLDDTLEPLISKYESFDSLVVIFNEIFHGTGNFYVNILKLLRLMSVSILFVLFLNLEASLIFHMIDILYNFPQESIFSKVATISKSNNIYYWIILFIFLSSLLVYTIKKSSIVILKKWLEREILILGN